MQDAKPTEAPPPMARWWLPTSVVLGMARGVGRAGAPFAAADIVLRRTLEDGDRLVVKRYLGSERSPSAEGIVLPRDTWETHVHAGHVHAFSWEQPAAQGLSAWILRPEMGDRRHRMLDDLRESGGATRIWAEDGTLCSIVKDPMAATVRRSWAMKSSAAALDAVRRRRWKEAFQRAEYTLMFDDGMSVEHVATAVLCAEMLGPQRAGDNGLADICAAQGDVFGGAVIQHCERMREEYKIERRKADPPRLDRPAQRILGTPVGTDAIERRRRGRRGARGRKAK